MPEGTDAPRRAHDNRRAARDEAWFVSRPDRVALWAFFLAVFSALIAAASSAEAGSSSGGISDPSSDESTSCVSTDFGRRDLALGDCGDDVKTLNWVLRATPYDSGLRLSKEFETPTDRSVRSFQRESELAADGVVDDNTRKALRRSMRKDVATWYGPGFFGNRTACGETLTRKTIGVAHKRLPCGTRVTFAYKGSFVRARVIDRGPFAHGARWDLTQKLARELGFEYTDKLRAGVIR